MVTGSWFSEVGNHLNCVDMDPRKIQMLNAGEVPIHEQGLGTLIRRNASAGRLQSTTDAAAVVAYGTMQFIGVSNAAR